MIFAKNFSYTGKLPLAVFLRLFLAYKVQEEYGKI